MMKFTQHYSGSKGNLYQLQTSSGASILLEAGVSIKLIKKALNFRLSGSLGAIISHAHKDHCIAVPDLMRSGIDCYMTAETARAMNLSGHRLHIIEAKKQFDVGPFSIMPFPTQHDCPGSVGFLIFDGIDKLVFATDTFYIRHKFKGLTMVAVECNWSIETLGPDLDSERKKRLYSSHFSLENVKKFLGSNDLSKVREIHLLHLSKENADPEMFINEIQFLTGIPVYTR